MAWWKVDLETGWLISLSLCEKWWLNGKLIWRQAVWSLCLYVRSDGWMEGWFEDRLSALSDFIVFMWKLMAGWKVDLKTGCLTSLSFTWELIAWWKVDLKTDWMISFSLCDSWWLDGELIWRQTRWSPFLCVRADTVMEKWYEDSLDDLLSFVWELMAWWKVDLETGWLISVFVWELMAWWKVDLKTGWLISLSLCEKWWLDGKLIWRQAVWSLCLYVRANGRMESWFEDKLDDRFLYVRANGWMESWFEDRLADLIVFVWELIAWWKVVLKTDWLISLSLCESWWLDGKLIWRQAGWSHCLCVRGCGLMESWFEDRLTDLFVFVWELMAWWKVDLKTAWLISLSLCERWRLDGKLIWRQAAWLHCLVYES